MVLLQPKNVLIPDRSLVDGLKLTSVSEDNKADCVVHLCEQLTEENGNIKIPGQDLLNHVAEIHSFKGNFKKFEIVHSSDTPHRCLLGFGSEPNEESFYIAGQTLGDKLYSENPTIVQLVFDEKVCPAIDEHKLRAFLHRFIFAFVKNQEYKSGKKDEKRRLKTLQVVSQLDHYTVKLHTHTYIHIHTYAGSQYL